MDGRIGGAIKALFIGLAVLVTAPIASAQDVERPEMPELQIEPCPDLAGIAATPAGVLFPRSTADCMLARLQGLALLVPYVHTLEAIGREHAGLDELHARALALADRDAELAGEQAAVASAALEAALRRARDAEAERDAWWRSPILWLAVGVVLTVVLEIAAVAALRGVD